MRRQLMEVDEVAALIESGETLLLAGDESRLRLLPRGRWIGGTIPYFMSTEGGVVDRRRVFAENLPEGLGYLGVRRYGEREIPRVYSDLPAGAMGIVIAPSGSRVHAAFALNAPQFARFATAPLFGWISGVHLAELSSAAPMVFDGTIGEPLGEAAVVMHVAVPAGKLVEISILNIFERGSGPAITFPTTGFTATGADVEGRRVDFPSYVREAGLDTRLPLVADYHGARVNVSFQAVYQGEVRFYAPVFAGVRYHLAAPVPDYVRAFGSALPVGLEGRTALSCNCVLNYVHGELEGKRTGILGPITFGEIAYQLLNQTLVYLTVTDRSPP